MYSATERVALDSTDLRHKEWGFLDRMGLPFLLLRHCSEEWCVPLGRMDLPFLLPFFLPFFPFLKASKEKKRMFSWCKLQV
jgi:hypothetical protein